MSKGQSPSGHGGQGWATFFRTLAESKKPDSNVSPNTLNSIRLSAEQQGVDYSWTQIADVRTSAANANQYEKIYFSTFKGVADTYRSLGIDGTAGPYHENICSLCAGNIDPRVWGGPLSVGSHLLEPLAFSIYTAISEPWRPR